MSQVAYYLTVIGGLNWGLTGIGMLAKTNFNVINLILGSYTTLEAVVYVLVGVSAIYMIVKK